MWTSIRDLREPKLGFPAQDRAHAEGKPGSRGRPVNGMYAPTDEAVILTGLILTQQALASNRRVIHRVEATIVVLTISVIRFETALTRSHRVIVLYTTSKIDIRVATRLRLRPARRKLYNVDTNAAWIEIPTDLQCISRASSELC